MTRLDDEAAVLARRVASLRDPQLRVAYVRALLRDTTAPHVFELVLGVAARAEVGDEAHRDLWLVMAVALADPECQEIRAETAQLARDRALSDVATLLETPESGPVSEEARRVPDFGTRDGKPLSLGERKALARRPGRDLVLRVLRDPHPDVIRILLGNPRVTEDDLVRLCARRPVAPEVLREVVLAPRWIVRYRVRVALLKNPYTPLDLALPLAAGLNAQDAREIAASSELPQALRDACARLGPPETLH
jgi:hypothetical protein